MKKKAPVKKKATQASVRRTTKPKRPPAEQSKRDRRIDLFAQEYIVDFNGRAAAIRAGYGATSARFEASRLLALPEVQEKVDVAIAARLKRVQLTGDQVLDRIRAIATADANTLIELRRTCCRHCYGKDNRYQRTPKELENHRRDFEAKIDKQCDDPHVAADLKSEFDEEGGIGWDPRKEPVDDCPECFGEGAVEPFVKDTRELTPEAKLLYRGVKVTQHGIQVLTADQDAMLRLLGEHAGLFRRKVEHSGPNGGPIQQESTLVSELMDQVAGEDVGIGPARSRSKAS